MITEHKELSKTIQRIGDDDQCANLIENYEFFAEAAAKEIENLADPTQISPFVITWKEGGSLENPSGYNDEFTAPSAASENDALNACLSFIESSQKQAVAASQKFECAIMAHAYTVPSPEDDSDTWNVLRVLCFLGDMAEEEGAVFYQRFDSDGGELDLIEDMQLGAMVRNILV